MMRAWACRLFGSRCQASPAWLLALVLAGLHAPLGAQDPVASGLSEPLSAMPADAVRGRKLLANRPKSLCLLCHSGPVPEVAFQGNLAPDLSGVGARYTAAQLRQRMVDPRAINPESIMPAYYDITGLTRVSDAWRDQPILSAQEIEDIIAFMVTLR